MNHDAHDRIVKNEDVLIETFNNLAATERPARSPYCQANFVDPINSLSGLIGERKASFKLFGP